jgi:hypothetical protein
VSSAALAAAPAPTTWEVLVLRGSPRSPQIAARLLLDAPDAQRALRAARLRARARAGAEASWWLGPLRALTPSAPGTRRYRVTFAAWRERGEGYAREVAHEIEVWATDAAGARRLAEREARTMASYEAAWRVVRVARD